MFGKLIILFQHYVRMKVLVDSSTDFEFIYRQTREINQLDIKLGTVFYPLYSRKNATKVVFYVKNKYTYEVILIDVLFTQHNLPTWTSVLS